MASLTANKFCWTWSPSLLPPAKSNMEGRLTSTPSAGGFWFPHGRWLDAKDAATAQLVRLLPLARDERLNGRAGRMPLQAPRLLVEPLDQRDLARADDDHRRGSPAFFRRGGHVRLKFPDVRLLRS